MTWTNVKLIFHRELRDQLRDRRTLFMVIVLPLLLYPALGIGLLNMTQSLSSQPQRIVVIRAEEMPTPPLIVDGKLPDVLLDYPGDADSLRIFTDDPVELSAISDEETRIQIAQFIEDWPNRLDDLRQLGLGKPFQEPSNLSPEGRALQDRVESWFETAKVQVLIVFPEGYREAYDALSDRLAAGEHPSAEDFELPEALVLHNSAKERSEIAYSRIRPILSNWEDELLKTRLAGANLPVSLPDPVKLIPIDLAAPDQMLANMWGKMFPALLVIMSVTGAFYPAIDLGAGEKERGTMETLLISPATRSEIVMGKFLTVVLFSLTAALLNLASIGFTGQRMMQAVASARGAAALDLGVPPLSAIVCVIFIAVPLASLFSALSLALAMFAKSSKEGQYYLTPLLLVALGLTVFCLYPGVELTPFYSVLPVIGPSLLLKALLLGDVEGLQIGFYVFPVLVTSAAYCGIALWWAIEQFQREDILFRESEQFEIGLWIQHLLREKQATPSFMQAGFCFVIIALMQFLFFTSLQESPELLTGARNMVTVQLIYLIATVGVPPLIMALILTSSFRTTLKLTWPNWRFLGAAIALGFALQPLALTLLSQLDRFFPPLPPGAERVMAAMQDEAVPFWLSLAAFAFAPAICEELAFRGFILSGLQRSGRTWVPIVISAVLFGVIHLIPKQQFNATLLGLVIGLLAVRSQSLLPGVLFHAIFNGTQVLATRLSGKPFPGAEWLVRVKSHGTQVDISFTPLLLTLCAFVATSLLYWLVQLGRDQNQRRKEQQIADERMSLHTT